MTRPPVDYIERTSEHYSALGYPIYQWVHNDDEPPFAAVSKPLAESRIGLVASGGIYRRGQIAFHYRDDVSFRVIPTDASMSDLRVTHFAYDVTDARADPNVVFPVRALRAEAREGGIGEAAPNAYTFMGGIYSTRRVREILAPALAERMEADAADAVVLVPA